MSKVKLHEYQKTALAFCMKRWYMQDEKGVGLFLDPGLGKTIVTLKLLEILRDLGEVENALVVAPLRVCQLVWAQEVKKWGFDFTVTRLCKRVKRGLREKPGFIELINYESLHLLVDHCDRWETLVLDESPKIKTWMAKRTRALRKMIPNFTKRLALTGTPASNSLADLHSQVFMLDGGVALGRNVTVFRSLYMQQGGWQGRQWFLRDGVAGTIHEAVAPLCLRLDAETCLDMPELVTHDIMCEMPPRCLKGYKQLKRDLLAQLDTGTVFAPNAAAAYMKMKQYANGQMYDEDRVVHPIHKVKVEALVDLVDELSGKPVLVFYQFAHDALAIKAKFPKAPVLCGGTKDAAAAKMLDDWNAGKTHVFLVQNQAASHGLNMQGAGNDVVYYGLNDSLEIYEQSFRRIYRQGVKGRQVRIYRLLTIGTVDEIIRDRLVGKDQTQKAFLAHLKCHAAQDISPTWGDSAGQIVESVVPLSSETSNFLGEAHEDRPALQKRDEYGIPA